VGVQEVPRFGTSKKVKDLERMNPEITKNQVPKRSQTETTGPQTCQLVRKNVEARDENREPRGERATLPISWGNEKGPHTERINIGAIMGKKNAQDETPLGEARESQMSSARPGGLKDCPGFSGGCAKGSVTGGYDEDHAGVDWYGAVVVKGRGVQPVGKRTRRI